jgi:hypothetical protein
MAAISVSTIQTNVSNAVGAISGGDFRRSTFPLLMFGKTQQTVAHLAYQVGANITNAISGRQKSNEGVECTTQIEVRFAYRVRPLSQNADYDNLLNKEQLIIKAVLDRTNATLYENTHFRFSNADRSISDSGEYFLSSTFYEAYHYLPIN